jgi:hypothetical protein
MPNCISTWEDEENNRRVDLAVDFAFDAGQVDITRVTPKRVSFVDRKTKETERSIGVWTDAGRKMLTRQAEKSGVLATIRLDIQEGRIVSRKKSASRTEAESTPSLKA